MSDCTGSQFKIIAKAKQALLDSTNIDISPDEMACLDNFLFRCWQMGWLDKYDDTKDIVEVVRCKDCMWWTKQEDSLQGRCTLMQSYPTGAWYCMNGERKTMNDYKEIIVKEYRKEHG